MPEPSLLPAVLIAFFIFHLLQNHPEAGVLGTPEGQLDHVLDNQAFAEGTTLWDEQLQQHPNNPGIIYNAANYFLLNDLDRAISLYKQGKEFSPEYAEMWDQHLGNAYNLKTIRNPNPSLANDALGSLENALVETKAGNRSYLLPNLAKAALAAGQLDKAADYAGQMLAASSNDWNKGNLIYFGNFIFGMLAVQKGDFDAAGKYLLAAGNTPGSPQLNSFGPNMSLAKDLLARGQPDTVLAFLKECLKFWNSSLSPCSRWIQEMEEGKTPDFRMNLNY